MESYECPFKKVDEILEKIKDNADIIIVDFHAEATSEKLAMGWYLDGRVTAVFGPIPMFRHLMKEFCLKELAI